MNPLKIIAQTPKPNPAALFAEVAAVVVVVIFGFGSPSWKQID
jgi:hypothetical protein